MHPALLPASIAILATVACSPMASLTPLWVTDREPLPSCGDEFQDPLLNEAASRVRTCLLDAYRAGHGAEMTSNVTTMEGDPITTIIRVHPDGSVEKFIDNTLDRYSSGVWELHRCSSLIGADESARVSPEEMVFIEDGCAQVPPP